MSIKYKSNKYRGIGLAFLLGLSSLRSPPILAFENPSAALHIMKKLGDSSKPGYISYDPFLLDMARAIARFGLPQGFFSAGETFSNQPGIDLRLMLLYDSGLVKIPLKLVLPNKINDEDAPRIANPIIPDPIKGSLKEVPGTNKSKSGSKRTKTIVEQKSSEGAAASADQSRVSYDLHKLEKEEEKSTTFTPSNNILSYSSPLTLTERMTNFDPKTAGQKFLHFWSYNGEKDKTTLSPNTKVGTAKGSFIINSSRVKSIQGRTFSVSQGSLLVSVQGDPITIETPAAKISLASGTTALIDMKDNEVVKVLESDSDSPANISLRKQSNSSIKCTAGEQATVDGKFDITKSSFSLKQVLDQEPLLKLTDKDHVDEIALLKALRERLESR